MKLTNSKLRQLIKEVFETEEDFLETVPAGEEQDEYGRSGSEAADTVETLNTMIEEIQELADRFALGNADMELDTQDDAREELENAVRHLEHAKRTVEEVLQLQEEAPPRDATDPESFETMGSDYGAIQKDLEKARFCVNKGFWVPIPQAKTEAQCAGYGWEWIKGHCGKCVKKNPREKSLTRRRRKKLRPGASLQMPITGTNAPEA